MELKKDEFGLGKKAAQMIGFGETSCGLIMAKIEVCTKCSELMGLFAHFTTVIRAQNGQIAVNIP
jgi:hypothetical protein